MRKKLFISLIVLICITLIGYLITFRFNIDSDKVTKIEVFLTGDSELDHKVITDKSDIKKVVDYFNSLVLIKSISRPKDAVDGLVFTDETNNTVKSISWGQSGILWNDKKTYLFGRRRINNITKLLKECKN
ncbi:hypothetical protein JHL18_04095 [Clostridium sp. YIM B02505]|uniref:Uncharacterized protein n=1 Tax=Clostridium yunnanense TaxID=2800325 RepID=A0ABS1EKD7_9CLOT|nr:hypothetical protein [Clostridium yunnanense]MBK1809820.1 hypothetical protein [Clostridium yunnanense]